jgi:hypothetical protein
MARSLTEPARELRAKHFVDKITDIADDGRNDFMRRATERGEEFVAVVRARVLPTELGGARWPARSGTRHDRGAGALPRRHG